LNRSLLDCVAYATPILRFGSAGTRMTGIGEIHGLSTPMWNGCQMSIAKCFGARESQQRQLGTQIVRDKRRSISKVLS
jgi:hypothetical protein